MPEKNILVKVNLNDLPWEDENIRDSWREEIEKLAINSEGFIELNRILPQYIHFLGIFENYKSAQVFAGKLMNKPYVGRVSFEDSNTSRRVMETSPPV